MEPPKAAPPAPSGPGDDHDAPGSARPVVPETPARRVADRGAATADRLRASKAWTGRDEAELDQRFEAAAVAALRVPALAERSAVLRRVGRQVIPARLRPMVRIAARSLDRAAALALERYDLARRSRP